MLATNYPNEDHIHEPVKALDPDSLPPRPDPLIPRLFAERCRVRRSTVHRLGGSHRRPLVPDWPVAQARRRRGAGIPGCLNASQPQSDCPAGYQIPRSMGAWKQRAATS